MHDEHDAVVPVPEREYEPAGHCPPGLPFAVVEPARQNLPALHGEHGVFPVEDHDPALHCAAACEKSGIINSASAKVQSKILPSLRTLLRIAAGEQDSQGASAPWVSAIMIHIEIEIHLQS